LRMLANLHELLNWPMQVLTEAEHTYLKGFETRNLSRENVDMITKQVLDRGDS